MKYKTLALTLVSTCALIFSACNKQPEKKYNITFVNDDEARTVLYETKVKKGQVPEYVGDEPTKESTAQYAYTWTGWDPALEAATQDQTYVATYDAVEREYQITFLNGDGSVLQSGNVLYGQTPVCAETPTKDPTQALVYTFDHWVPEVAPVTGPQTYTPVFTDEARQYQITFKNGDGSNLKQYNVAYGALPTCEEEPTMAQDDVYTYTFNHWDPAIAEVSGDQVYTPVFDAHVRALDVNEEYDFTQFKYGASEMRNFDDDVSWAMPAAEAHKIKYKVYAQDTFELRLPRIIYSEHPDVSMTFEGTNYHGRVLLGLDEDDITHGDGVESDRDIVGTLMLSYMDGKLYQSLAFGTMTINNVIEDDEIIAGIKPVTIYVKALFDRYFNVYNITFGTENFVTPTYDLTNNYAGAYIYKGSNEENYLFASDQVKNDTHYTSTADHLMYVGYDMNTFRFGIPKLNFALFKSLTMDLSAPGWNSNAKIGLKADDINYTTGSGDTNPVGNLTFALVDGKLIADLYFGQLHLTEDITDPDVIIGNKNPEIFITAYYNRIILVSNIHASLDKSYKLKTDWANNKMGAALLIGADDKTWGMNQYTTADVLGYRVWDQDTFTLRLPKIKYSGYQKVEYELQSTQWQSGVKFGLSSDDVKYSTSQGADAGGNIDNLSGSLKVVNDGTALAVTLTLGDTQVSINVTDADIMSGAKSIDMFVTALYNRNLLVNSVNFQYK